MRNREQVIMIKHRTGNQTRLNSKHQCGIAWLHRNGDALHGYVNAEQSGKQCGGAVMTDCRHEAFAGKRTSALDLQRALEAPIAVVGEDRGVEEVEHASLQARSNRRSRRSKTYRAGVGSRFGQVVTSHCVWWIGLNVLGDHA